MAVSVKPSQEVLDYIRDRFDYEPDTGKLFRFNEKRECWIELKPALYYYPNLNRWQVVKIKVTYQFKKHIDLFPHNICWFLYYKEWPDKEVDHRDLDQTNNKIDNLRPATRAVQNINRSNKGKYLPGVRYNKLCRNNPFEAQIKYKRKNTHLGYYTTELEAHLAYRVKYQELYGEPLPPSIPWSKPIVEELSFEEAKLILANFS